MYVTTRTFTRPSNTVPWHWEAISESEEFAKRLEKDFIENQKIVVRAVSTTDLTAEVFIVWQEKEYMEEHFNHPDNADYFEKRDEYNKSVNITDTLVCEEV